jgi:hypothetical protein
VPWRRITIIRSLKIYSNDNGCGLDKVRDAGVEGVALIRKAHPLGRRFGLHYPLETIPRLLST